VLDSGPGGLVKTAMALLDPTDPLQQALDVDIPGNFFTSLPIPETRASGTEMCSMVAIYTSIEDPFLVHHKGRVFRDRDSTGRPHSVTNGIHIRRLAVMVSRHWTRTLHPS